MSQPLVTIVTPTYNRPTLFAECAAAVMAQRFPDWLWWVVFNTTCWPLYEAADYWEDPRIVPIWFPTSEDERSQRHIPSQIVNWLYPKVTTPYIYFLADDDLIDPGGLGILLEGFYDGQDNPRHEAVYGRCEVQDQQPDGSFKTACWCYDAGDVGLGTNIDPHCLLDGGQVLHTKALWDQATADGWQQTAALDTAAAQDGLLLRRLAQFARFHYVPQRIVTHRRHSGASFHRPQL